MMATQPVGPRRNPSPSTWYTGSPTYSHSYLLDGVRAGLIALVLLVIFAVIVLF